MLEYRVHYETPARTQAVMKLTTDRPYADPEAAARKLIEIANSVCEFHLRKPGAFNTGI
jgi:hypothetical protein